MASYGCKLLRCTKFTSAPNATRMTTVIRADGRLFALVKGCRKPCWTRVVNTWPTTAPHIRWTTAKNRLCQVACAMRRRWRMRTLAFAYAVLPADVPADEESLHATRDSLEKNLIYVGFVAIRDPLRDDVKALSRSAGRRASK